MHDLELEYYLGIKDKVAVRRAGAGARGRDAGSECAMVGDDLPDVPLLQARRLADRGRRRAARGAGAWPRTVTRRARRPRRGARGGRAAAAAQRHVGRRCCARYEGAVSGPRRRRATCWRWRARWCASRPRRSRRSRARLGAEFLRAVETARRLPRQGHRLGRGQVAGCSRTSSPPRSPAPARPRCSCTRPTRCTATPACSRPGDVALFISKSGAQRRAAGAAALPRAPRHPAGEHRRHARLAARRARADVDARDRPGARGLPDGPHARPPASRWPR